MSRKLIASLQLPAVNQTSIHVFREQSIELGSLIEFSGDLSYEKARNPARFDNPVRRHPIRLPLRCVNRVFSLRVPQEF